MRVAEFAERADEGVHAIALLEVLRDRASHRERVVVIVRREDDDGGHE